MNSHETKQLTERQSDPPLQHCPQSDGILVAFAQGPPKSLDEFRVGPRARRLLSCLHADVEAHRRRLALRGRRFRYRFLHRIGQHPPKRRGHRVFEARIGRVLVLRAPPLAPFTQRLRGRVPYHDDVPERAVPSSQRPLPDVLQPQSRPRHEVVDRVLRSPRVFRKNREPQRKPYHQRPVAIPLQQLMVRSLGQLPLDLRDHLVRGSPLFHPRGASPPQALSEFVEIHRVLVCDAVPCPHRAFDPRRRHRREHLGHLQPLESVLDLRGHVDQVDEPVARVVPSSADLGAVRPPIEIHAHERLPARLQFCATRPVHLPQPVGPVPVRNRRPFPLSSRLLGVEDAQTRH